MPFKVLESFTLEALPGNCSVEFYRNYPVPEPSVRLPPEAKLAWGDAVWIHLPDGTPVRLNVGRLPNEYNFALEMFLIDRDAGTIADDVGPLADWLLAEGVSPAHVLHRAHVDEDLGQADFARLGKRIAQAMKDRAKS